MAYFEELLRLKGADALDKRGILEATEHGIDGCFPVASAIAMPFRIGGDEFVVFAGMTQKQVESTLLELKHTTEK